MSLRILIAHSLPGQRGTTQALYIGSSGSELDAAKAAAPAHVGSFSIINNPPSIRKGNPLYDPSAQAPAAGPAASPMKPELPADLKGLNKAELASACQAAIHRIKELEAIVAELRESRESQSAPETLSSDSAPLEPETQASAES